MAKKSSVEKNQHRRELAAQYAARRAELRAVTRDRKREPGGALRGDAGARRAAAQQRAGAACATAAA